MDVPPEIIRKYISHIIRGWYPLFVGFSLNFFILEGYTRGYGLVYLELLELFDKGAQNTGLVGTIYAIVGVVVCKLDGNIKIKMTL